MTKHLILGAGNLGLDLAQAASDRATLGHSYLLDGKWRLGEGSLPELIEGYDVIWCCIGGGSIDYAMREPVKAYESLVMIPQALMDIAQPKQRLVFFSSDYCASPYAPGDHKDRQMRPRTKYEALKLELEDRARRSSRPLVRVVRVSNLYGFHRPHLTLPGKIKALPARRDAESFPTNLICPTPTPWLAGFLLDHLDQLFLAPGVVHHCAPSGSISVISFAQLIRGPEYRVKPRGQDRLRPSVSSLGCSFAKTPPMLELLRRYAP